MSIRISKVADLVGTEIVFSGHRRPDTFIKALVALEKIESDGPQWTFPLTIGEGQSARLVNIQMAPFLSNSEIETSKVEPVVFSKSCAFFRGKFFQADRQIHLTATDDEATLRIKKIAYDEEAELQYLRSYIANVEATETLTKTDFRREAIPDHVKLLIWKRDVASCARCGSNDKIHFDHIVPVSKGGSNLAENIQLLCQKCNLKKSDNIAF